MMVNFNRDGQDQTPEISVIVPVYKAERFLRHCAESILQQSFTSLELLLIDDGSPDGSGRLCDTLASEDLRIRVIHKENGGVSSARNRGLEEARGRFIAFVDADDCLVDTEALKTLHQLVEQNGVDSAGCAHYRVEPDGSRVVERAPLPAGVYDAPAIREGIVHPLVGDRLGRTDELFNGFVWRFLFQREIIKTQKLRFSGAYLEDELFLLEYFCHAKSLAMCDRPFYGYLQNPKSVTRNYLPDYMETFCKFMKLKEAVVERFGLMEARPLWRENSNWSGLLIAVGNEYAPGNQKPLKEKTRRVKALCHRPEMRAAMEAIRPQGLSRNKQMVVNLLQRRMFGTLSLLYAVKHRKG